MKVPYLQKKVKADFKAYFDAYERQVAASFVQHKENKDAYLAFKSAYPLFVFLESLQSEEYSVDPTSQIALDEYLSNGMVVEALKQARVSSYKTPDNNFIKMATVKRKFTPYIEELYSDMLVMLNNYYQNNYRGCFIAVRCILEDLYRHLYYKDHVQEFWAIRNGEDEHSIGVKPLFLREYLTRVQYLSGLKNVDINFEKPTTNNYTNIFSWNNELYSLSSSYVHGSNECIMNKFIKCSDLIFDQDKADKVIKLLNDVVKLSVTFLICAHFELFVKFNDYEKSLVLEAIPKSVRANFRSLVNV